MPLDMWDAIKKQKLNKSICNWFVCHTIDCDLFAFTFATLSINSQLTYWLLMQTSQLLSCSRGLIE